MSTELAGFRPVDEVIEEVDAEAYFALLEERFGIPRESFSDYRVFRPNAKCLAIVDRRLEVPAGSEPLAVGMPFLYVNRRHPRLTTAATVRFGAGATCNTVDLKPREVEDFIDRRELPLRPEEEAKCTGPGYVIGRHRGMILGLGHAQDGEGSLIVLGMVPRSWNARWRSLNPQAADRAPGRARDRRA